jgi:hypothetical protein
MVAVPELKVRTGTAAAIGGQFGFELLVLRTGRDPARTQNVDDALNRLFVDLGAYERQKGKRIRRHVLGHGSSAKERNGEIFDAQSLIHSL